MRPQSIAIFDFDGTITSKDTLGPFIIFTRGRWRYYLGLVLLSPILIGFFLKLVSRHKVKESLFTFFFKSTSAALFDEWSRKFVRKKLPGLIRAKALERIRFHLSNNDKVLVVSASPESWVKQWAALNGCDALGTCLEKENGKLTGKISGKNCQGVEKVYRINEFLNMENYDKISTYGDTPGDRPFLQLGHFRHYKPFR